MLSDRDGDVSKRLERHHHCPGSGERSLVERNGAPVAALNCLETSRQAPIESIITELKEFRSQHHLRGISIRAMIEEGRR